MVALIRNKVSELVGRTVVLAVWVSIMVGSLSFLSMAQTLQTNFPVTNGTINAMVQSGNNIFLGGSFSYVGNNTGRGVGIDTTTGNYVTGYPDVNGTIYAVASDGVGGWYIGGFFSQVGGVVRNSLAHIKSDKTVDSWNPNINDGAGNFQTVYTITKYGSLIYVGGLFTQVGSALRTNVAAIDSATGLANTWNPKPDNGVYAIIVTPQYTFLGGVFTYFNGAIDTTNVANIPGGITNNKRQGVAELYTGQNILTMYNTSISSAVSNGLTPYGLTSAAGVYAMQLANGKLYCAGNFGALGGNTSYGLTSIDTTNTYTPTATGFSPNKNSGLKYRPSYALAVSGDTVFVGGEFFYFGPYGTVRNHIAAALISTKAAIAWNPNVAVNISSSNELSYPYYVNAIVVANGTVYVSGKFATINTSVARGNIAAISQGTGTVTSWNPNTSAAAYAIALQGSTLYTGGNFTSVNGQTRNNLCEINAASGTLTAWNPNPSGTALTSGYPNSNGIVNAFALSSTTLFAGGSFTTIGGQSRQYLAGIDTASGLATAWQANASGTTSCLAVGGGKLYVGGTFSTIGGIGTGDSARNNIASIDTASTARVSSWNPNADGSVNVVAISGSTVYAGGSFQNIGGQARFTCAAISTADTGLATAWNPNISAGGAAKAIAISGSTIYVGGVFTNSGGAARNNIAALDATTALATAWNPNITSGGTLEVDAITVNGSTIYAGGYFASVGATTRSCVAAIDASTGSATTWNPNAGGYVYSILADVTNHKIYLGGNFSNVLNQTASSFAAVDNPGDASLPVELVSLTGTVLNQSNVELQWKTATEMDNYGFDVERRMLGGNNAAAWTKVGFVHGAGTSASTHDYAFSDRQLSAGRYGYRIRQIDNAGSSKYTQTIEIEVGSVPQRFTLSQNYPNPFNPTTMLSFTLPNDGRAVLKVFNVIGQEVATLFDQDAAGGKVYQAQFDATKLPSGIYFSHLEFGGKELVRKLLLVK